MKFWDLYSRFPMKLIADLRNTPQDSRHHPEGNVFEHTKQVFELASLTGDKELEMAALFHDLGKIECTFLKDNTKIVAYGHELKAKEYIEKYKILFEDLDIDWKKVAYICRYHMLAHRLDEMRAFKVEALKASPYFEDLMRFAKCDNEGRKPR